jgi:putative transposase
LICSFITAHKGRFGVQPICQALSVNGIKIAPSTYYAHLRRAPSKRALSDLVLTEVMAGYYELQIGSNGKKKRAPESLYGTTKMWAHLNRQGIVVAKCTVARIKCQNGWKGVVRTKRVRTTEADPKAPRAADLVNRDFGVAEPNELVVADFTYVPLAGGSYVYTAFVIDAFAGLITGWECSSSMRTEFVESAVRQGADYRGRQGHPMVGDTIHHSDAGSQYTSIRFGEQLFLAGMIPSIGSVADAYDNSLAETTIGLYKTEAIRSDSPFRDGPLRTLADVETITSDWVAWYNNSRLMHRLGRIPPTECEAAYYDEISTHEPVEALK